MSDYKKEYIFQLDENQRLACVNRALQWRLDEVERKDRLVGFIIASCIGSVLGLLWFFNA